MDLYCSIQIVSVETASGQDHMDISLFFDRGHLRMEPSSRAGRLGGLTNAAILGCGL